MTIDPRSETRTALSGLLGKFTILTLTLGVVYAGLGLLRITSQGWYANVITDPFLFQPQTWATQIASFAADTAVIIVVGGTLNNRLTNSLNAVTLQADELRESERRYRLLADLAKSLTRLTGSR